IVLLRGLSARREDRFGSVDELLEALGAASPELPKRGDSDRHSTLPLKGARVGLALLGVGVLGAGVVWYFASRGGGRSQTETAPPASIAVLPFVNLSGGQENEYFSDGMTEEIINALANVEGV